jgi:hypothetical protein
MTEEQKANLEKQRTRTKEARATKARQENWWVELQKHYMTAKDHQDALFEQARAGRKEEIKRMMKEEEDRAKGKAKKFDIYEHIDEEDIEMVEKPPSKKQQRERPEGEDKKKKKK